MLITHERVLEHLERAFAPEGEEHIDLMADLAWAATITAEFAFQCPRDDQEKAKERFLDFVTDTPGRQLAHRDFAYTPVFPHESRLPTAEDLVVVRTIVQKLTCLDQALAKEKVAEWLREAWALGAYQQRVYSLEVEGGIMNEFGIVANFGCKLALFGAREGLLPS